MEAVMNSGMIELNEMELMIIDGGRDWIGVVGGAATMVGGAAGFVGGVAALATPEPTGVTKVAGYAGVVGGSAAIVGGFAQVVSSW